MKKNVKPGKTPAEITVSMIDEDLKDGISKPEMATKYGIKPYEVDEMFKHPFLKGRRPSRKKALSFSFVDDVTDLQVEAYNENNPPVDPNQVTLEQAIEESTAEIETAVNELKDVNKTIVDMLGPTDPEETFEDMLDSMVNKDGQSLKETFDKEIEAGNAPEEEELEELEDDTFEL